MLLYWGASWCPPCNRLKEEIFSHPQFQHLTDSVIRVYIDGDDSGAQQWGEKLKAYGYPTLLLLTPAGEEKLRLASSVSWDEFQAIFTAALQEAKHFRKVLARALAAPQASESDLSLLAYATWENSASSASERAQLLLAQEKLLAKVPDHLPQLRGRLIAMLLGGVSALPSQSPGELGALRRRVGKHAKFYCSAMLSSPESIWGAREAITSNSSPLLSWAKEHITERPFKRLLLKWVRAAEFIRTHPQARTDTRLWAIYTHAAIARLATRQALAPGMLAALKAAVADADASTTTVQARNAVIDDAAWILQEFDQIAHARQLLKKEIKTSDTPWYYLQSLSRLEERLGNRDGALYWSRKAKKAASGQNTRLEWIVADLLTQIRLEPDNIHAVNRGISEYYDTALSLVDGFSGRNEFRAKRIASALKPLKSKIQVSETLAFYKLRCQSLEEPMRTTCSGH